MSVFSFFVSILVLGVLIFVHELGHFLVAKYFRVGVLQFAIGFGRKLWSRTYGETTYSIRAIPLGGYVRMVGDDPRAVYEGQGAFVGSEEHHGDDSETGEKEDGSLLETLPEDLTPEQRSMLEDESRWFLRKSFWPKTWIVLAGPFFNFFFAFLLAVGSFLVYGKDVAIDDAIIGEVVPGYPAEEAGLERGDKVVAIDTQPIATWEEMAKSIAQRKDAPFTLTIERSADKVEADQKPAVAPDALPTETLKINITAREQSPELALVSGVPEGEKSYIIGISRMNKREPATVYESVRGGAYAVWYLSEITVVGIYGMIRGLISPEHISGPITILSETAKRAKSGFEDLIGFVILISVSLAVLNLLPIPVLDGGHLFIFIIEAIKGGTLGMRAREWANAVGMTFLLLLMVFAIGNDLFRLLSS